MGRFSQFRWRAALVVGLLGSALTQPAYSEELTLSPASPGATVNGVTVGVFGLANLAIRDRDGRICTGFADTTPDHTLTLQEPFNQLTFRVDSGGNDTTLLVQGPGNDLIYCGEDVDRRNLDAQLVAHDLPTGTYRIWVGAQNQGQRYSYTLRVNP